MELTINNTVITQDSEGRYSLNDLHKAAGNNNRHKPAFFYRSDSFQKVVEVLKLQNCTFNPIVKKTGKYGGTWVCKELVYKYAMWISAEFEVKVIQTFDALASKHDAPETMKALNDLTKKIEDDKELASKCGHLLAKYRKVKKKNEDDWVDGIRKVQFTLGFDSNN